MEGLTLCATCILITCEWVHFFCHFELNHNTSQCKIIKPIADNLAFYPSLWTLYVLFLIILSSTITIMELLDISHTIITHSIPFTIIILSCWETLFSFHRYYKLKYYTKNRRTIHTKRILKRFLIFIAIYTPLFLFQMLFIPFLYPLIIIIYVIFNIFCEYQFVKMLLIQYGTLTSFDKLSASNIETSMIRAVYIMAFCSLLSIIISSFLLYNVTSSTSTFLKDPCFYPVFWCLSVVFYMFNFVQNREMLQKILRKVHCTDCRRKHKDNPLQRQETVLPDGNPENKSKLETLSIQTNANASEIKRAKALELLGLQPAPSNKTPRINSPIHAFDRGISSSETDLGAAHEQESATDLMQNIDENKEVPRLVLPRAIPINSNESVATEVSMDDFKSISQLNLQTTHALSAPSAKGDKEENAVKAVPRVRSQTGDGSDELVILEENKESYDQDDFSDTMTSWNMLALYGFYSKMNVNSLSQLRQYNNYMSESFRHMKVPHVNKIGTKTVIVHKARSVPNTKTKTESNLIPNTAIPISKTVSNI